MAINIHGTLNNVNLTTPSLVLNGAYNVWQDVFTPDTPEVGKLYVFCRDVTAAAYTKAIFTYAKATSTSITFDSTTSGIMTIQNSSGAIQIKHTASGHTVQLRISYDRNLYQ